MKIGLVENTYGNKIILMFYRETETGWRKIKSIITDKKNRMKCLSSIKESAIIYPLGRGT